MGNVVGFQVRPLFPPARKWFLFFEKAGRENGGLRAPSGLLLGIEESYMLELDVVEAYNPRKDLSLHLDVGLGLFVVSVGGVRFE